MDFWSYLYVCVSVISNFSLYVLVGVWLLAHSLLKSSSIRNAMGICKQFILLVLYNLYPYWIHLGHLVVQLVEALRNKPEGHGFDSWWFHWNFSLNWSFRPHYDPGVDSASNRNEYQEYFMGGKGGRCVWLTTLPPSCAEWLEIWEPHPSGTLRVCPGL